MSPRILVIEDNPTNLNLMTYLLTAFGHAVFQAGDGEIGLELAAQKQPDLILCDLQLPGTNGYEVARRVKAQASLSHIPIVAVTAYAMLGDRDRGLAAGFDGYLEKPIDPETFVPHIEQYLKSPGQPRPVTAVPEQPPQVNTATASKGITVLTVDDSPANQQVIETILRMYGYRVQQAASVVAALQMMERGSPDLVICDLHMPNLSGFELIKAVKLEPGWRAIPVILMSSTAWSERDRSYGLSLGASRFIARPLEPQAFIAEMEACLASWGH